MYKTVVKNNEVTYYFCYHCEQYYKDIQKHFNDTKKCYNEEYAFFCDTAQNLVWDDRNMIDRRLQKTVIEQEELLVCDVCGNECKDIARHKSMNKQCKYLSQELKRKDIREHMKKHLKNVELFIDKEDISGALKQLKLFDDIYSDY
jgi:hypothetical protein